ncbi:hypothetical protein ACIGXF_38060 [Streptomyces sp. NPDC053086]|uniref:hypothetical protein n=1 Tax=unclassified Streptomyces TaxID=2593676 RepID=UPI0037CDFA94
MFDTYTKLGFDLPALIPQVYLNYDPVQCERVGRCQPPYPPADGFPAADESARPGCHRGRGIQHYARQVDALTMQRPGTVWLADPGRYASMVAEDRQLTLQAYDVYRIGGHELRNHAAGEPCSPTSSHAC